MKIYKEDSEIHNKVKQVTELMDKLGLNIEFLGNSIHISDNSIHNAVLIGTDGARISTTL